MGHMIRLAGVNWLVLLLVQNSSESSGSSYDTFGCRFVDDNFNLQQRFSTQPQFGELAPANIIEFNDRRAFEFFVLNIDRIYSEFVSSVSYDTLSRYLQFYETYSAVKGCPGFPNFQSFYYDYPVQIERESEPGGNIIALMEKIVHFYPLVAQSSYFITRSNHGVRDSRLDNLDPTSPNLPDFFHHDQIAAIIKYKLTTGQGTSYGYILLDPEIMKTLPVYFSHDYDARVTTDGQVMVRMLVPTPENKYIIASVESSREVCLYYFREPFCSLVETTVKPNLLKLFHTRGKIESVVSIGRLEANVARPGLGLQTHERLPKHNFGFISNWDRVLTFTFPVSAKEVDNQLKRNKIQLQRVLSVLGLELNCAFWVRNILLLQNIWMDTLFLTECQYTLQTLKESPIDNSQWVSYFESQSLTEERSPLSAEDMVRYSSTSGTSVTNIMSMFMRRYNC